MRKRRNSERQENEKEVGNLIPKWSFNYKTTSTMINKKKNNKIAV